MSEETKIDIDTYLLEKVKNLHKDFEQFGRQVLIVAQVSDKTQESPHEGCTYFHVGKPTEDKAEFGKAVQAFLWRVDQFIQAYTGNRLRITPSAQTTVPTEEVPLVVGATVVEGPAPVATT